MKPLLTILCLVLACCAPVIPRAVIVDTKALVETTGKVVKSSGEVSRAIVKVEESADRAIEKGKELQRKNEIVREKAPADPALQKALADQERATGEVLAELDQTKLHVKDLATKNAIANEDVLTLQYVVSEVVTNANKANEASAALEKIASRLQPTKDKLAWWRWYGMGITAAFILVVGGYLFLRLSNAAAAVYLRSVISFRL